MSVTVSFVIPAYRAATTLGRTLESIRRQRVRDWEAIVVDDGSDDETVPVARQWCARDARIRLLEGARGGAAAARNRGLARARGDWIVFLDADDTIHPAFLSRMLRAATRATPPADVVLCGYDRVDPSGRITAKVAALPVDRSPVLVCASGPPGAIHSFLVRRALLDRVGGFDTSLPTNEDWDLWLRIAQSGARFVVIEDRLATYWASPGSLSRDGPRMLADSRVVMERARALDIAPVAGLELFYHGDYSNDDLSLRDAFWSAGVAIGQGGTAMELIGAIPPGASARAQMSHLSEKFVDGLVVGSTAPMSRLIALWPSLRPHVAAFFDAATGRVGTPGAGRSLLRACEVLIARNGAFSHGVVLGDVEAVALRPGLMWRGHVPAAGCDLVVLRATGLRPASYFSFAAPVFGRLTPADIARTIVRSIARRGAVRLRRHGWGARALARGGRFLALARRVLGRRAGRSPIPQLSAGKQRAARIAMALAMPAPIAPRRETNARPHPGAGSSAAEWDRFFETEDPWDYGSRYEQLKYRRTLDLIPVRPDARALELACAEGRFTQMLAPRVGELVAADISETAIGRARRRTAAFAHVSFRRHDLFADRLPTGFDVITCCEVLYFAPSRARLDWLAGEIAAALNPGGHFVHAHAYELRESPQRTAFDWCDTVGAEGIQAAFAARPELKLVRTVETELYRIDLFRKWAEGEPVPAHAIERMPIGAEIEPGVAGDIVWNGAILTRAQARARTGYSLPVFRIEGEPSAALESQLRFLRRRGFASVTPDALADSAARAGRLRGRPIMLLARDPGAGKRRALWDAVRSNGFGLHLIATPDARSSELRECLDEGMTLGSALVSGVPCDELDSDSLLEAAITARMELERWSGTPVRTAYPAINLPGTFVEQVFATAGYRRLFVDGDGAAPVTGQDMATPVMRLRAGMTLEALAALLGPDIEAPDANDPR